MSQIDPAVLKSKLSIVNTDNLTELNNITIQKLLEMCPQGYYFFHDLQITIISTSISWKVSKHNFEKVMW